MGIALVASLATSTVSFVFKDLEPVVEQTFSPAIVAEAHQETLRESAERIADEHKVSFTIMNRIITDESRWNPDAVGAAGELGLAQIYLKYHPSVSVEEAKDPLFSMDFIAHELIDGNESAHTVCNCKAEVRRLGAKVPVGTVQPNTPYPRVGGVIILMYDGTIHYAYIDSVEVDGIHISEANYIKCSRTKRVIDRDDVHIVGFWHDVE